MEEIILEFKYHSTRNQATELMTVLLNNKRETGPAEQNDCPGSPIALSDLILVVFPRVQFFIFLNQSSQKKNVRAKYFNDTIRAIAENEKRSLCKLNTVYPLDVMGQQYKLVQ